MDKEQRESDFYREFGQRVKNSRVNRGLTQADLATQLGLTRSSVANLESGRQRIQVHLLPVISKALEVGVAELLPAAHGDVAAGVTPYDSDAWGVSETARQFVLDSLRIAAPGEGNGAAK